MAKIRITIGIPQDSHCWLDTLAFAIKFALGEKHLGKLFFAAVAIAMANVR